MEWDDVIAVIFFGAQHFKELKSKTSELTLSIKQTSGTKPFDICRNISEYMYFYDGVKVL